MDRLYKFYVTKMTDKVIILIGIAITLARLKPELPVATSSYFKQLPGPERQEWKNNCNPDRESWLVLSIIKAVGISHF